MSTVEAKQPAFSEYWNTRIREREGRKLDREKAFNRVIKNLKIFTDLQVGQKLYFNGKGYISLDWNYGGRQFRNIVTWSDAYTNLENLAVFKVFMNMFLTIPYEEKKTTQIKTLIKKKVLPGLKNLQKTYKDKRKHKETIEDFIFCLRSAMKTYGEVSKKKFDTEKSTYYNKKILKERSRDSLMQSIYYDKKERREKIPYYSEFAKVLHQKFTDKERCMIATDLLFFNLESIMKRDNEIKKFKEEIELLEVGQQFQNRVTELIKNAKKRDYTYGVEDPKKKYDHAVKNTKRSIEKIKQAILEKSSAIIRKEMENKLMKEAVLSRFSYYNM